MTKQIREWIKEGRLYHIFDISCNTCDPSKNLLSLDKQYNPFIVINTHSNYGNHRQRRHVDCSADSTECCREDLYISFKDIGWDNWIIQPEGFHAYFCRGSCPAAARLTSGGGNHAIALTVSSFLFTYYSYFPIKLND